MPVRVGVRLAAAVHFRATSAATATAIAASAAAISGDQFAEAPLIVLVNLHTRRARFTQHSARTSAMTQPSHKRHTERRERPARTDQALPLHRARRSRRAAVPATARADEEARASKNGKNFFCESSSFSELLSPR